MLQRTALMGLGLLLSNTTLLAAQGANQSRGHQHPTKVEHATVGKLEAFDVNARIMVLAPAPDLRPESTSCAGKSETFSVTQTTAVLGTTEADRLGSLSEQVGGVVVVRYADSPNRPEATRVWVVDEPTVLEVSGSIVQIDRADRTLVLRNKVGAEETMHLRHDFLVDSDAGLIDMSGLRDGQMISAYYTKEGTANQARLLRVVS